MLRTPRPPERTLTVTITPVTFASGVGAPGEQEGELKKYLMRSNHNASLLRSPSGHFLIAQKPALLQAHFRCTLPRMQLTNEIARNDVNGYIPLPDPAAFS